MVKDAAVGTAPKKTNKTTADPIERLRQLCLALPEVEEKPFGGHTSPAWRVRDKLFVTTADDGTWMNAKGAPGVQQALIAGDPECELVEEAWRRTAPKRIVAQWEATT